MLRLFLRGLKFLFVGPAPKVSSAISGKDVFDVHAALSGPAMPPSNSHANGTPAPVPDPTPDDASPFVLEPANGWLIVERMEMESRSPGGIVIPDQAKELNVKVVVLATSRPWTNDHGVTLRSAYRSGDFLVISRYAGQQLVLDHGQLKVTTLRECDVIARIRMNRHADHIPDAVCLPPEKQDASLEYQADTVRREEYGLSRNG